MATYYLDPTGVDDAGRDGLSTPTAWKTLAYACNTRVTSGTNTIHLNAGTYNESARCNLAPGVSIEGEGDTSNIISTYNSGSIVYGLITMYSSSAGTDGNQSVSYIKLDGSSITGYAGISVYKRSNVNIHHCTLVDFSMIGILFGGEGIAASTSDPGTPPTTYEHDNNIYNCTINNCADSDATSGHIYMFSQTEMTIHDNTFTQNTRTNNDGDIIKAWGGHCKGVKVYNNIFTKPNYNSVTWNFHMETGSIYGGWEVYNNEFYGGGVGMDIGAYQNIKTTYAYTAWIHDNLFKQNAQIASTQDYSSSAAVTMEATCEDIIINNNYIVNLACGTSSVVNQTPRHHQNIWIYNNIYENIGYSDNGWNMLNSMATTGTGVTIEYIYYLNNIIISGNDRSAFFIDSSDNINHIYIQNNIIENCNGYGWLNFWSGAGTIDNIYVQNNILLNNVNSDAIYYHLGKTVTNLVGWSPQTNLLATDPTFVGGSPYDYHLQAGSPAIGTGINVGLTTDYAGAPWLNPPSIGAYEYGTLSTTITIGKARIHKYSVA